MHVSCNVKIMYHWYNIEWGSRNNKCLTFVLKLHLHACKLQRKNHVPLVQYRVG